MKYAVQLYSLREYGEKHGLRAVLELVARTGYDGVEFAGYYGHSAEEVASMLKELGLTAVSSHVGLDALAGDFRGELLYLQQLGIRTPVIPYIGLEQLEEFQGVSARIAQVSEWLAREGMQLGYHNHAHELNGIDYLQKLTEAVPGLKLELDVFWAKVAGRDPVELMRKYGDKLEFVHIKELNAAGSEADNPVVGEGITGTDAVIRQAGQAISWLILELERISIPEEEYLEKSLAAMKRMAEEACC